VGQAARRLGPVPAPASSFTADQGNSSGSGANAVPTGGQGMMERDCTVGRAELPRVNTITTRLTVLPFLNLLRRGVTIDVHAEAGDERFLYVTSTEILDSDPDGEGGVVLTLHATIEEGQLWLPASVIEAAEEGPDGWEIHHGGLVLRFGLVEGEPAFGPDGLFTHNSELFEEHREWSERRDVIREAKLREQKGQ
jgi:hypothetical protein